MQVLVRLKVWLTTFSLLVIVSVPLAANEKSKNTELAAIDVRAIMKAAYDRDDGKTQFSRQKLSSCRYMIKNKKMVCSEKPRIKVLDSVRKDYGATEKDKRSVSILVDPPAERGIAFLQYDYEDTNKDSDQWMYLSALGKVKRIVAGNDDEPKKGSFFGSEFGYEDLEQRHLDDYTYKLIDEELYQKRPCWVVESTPLPAQAKKSNYSKSVSWVDKERDIVLKTVLYNRQGKKEKRLTLRRVKQVDGIWTAHAVSVNNLQTNRMSQIKLESTAYNRLVDDNFLTQRTLTDGAFRETSLKKLRE